MLHRLSQLKVTGARVTFNCGSYVMCDIRWRQTQLIRLYMLSLAATWITATVFCLVYATVHWGNCSQSKMPLLVWLPIHWNLTTSYLCRTICIGFRSVNELYSKPPCWFTSFCVVWRLRIWVSLVDQFQLFRAVDSFGLTQLAFFMSQEQRRPLVAEFSQLPVQSRATVYLLSWEYSKCLFRLLPSVWGHKIFSTVIDCMLPAFKSPFHHPS